MNERIDFRPLESLADEWDEAKANSLFRDYLKKLEKYLDIVPIDKHVSISMAKGEDSKDISAMNVFEAWVDRNYSDKSLKLTIFEECGNLLPFVLLREFLEDFKGYNFEYAIEKNGKIKYNLPEGLSTIEDLMKEYLDKLVAFFIDYIKHVLTLNFS